MHEVCISHNIPRAWDSKGEASKRVVKNMEEINVGTKEKSPKQGLTSAEDLTIEFFDGRESPYHRLD